MKIAITDANLLVELTELGLIDLLLQTGAEVHCTIDLISQLPPIIKQQLPTENTESSFFVHAIQGEECLRIYNEGFYEGMTHGELTSLFVAKKIGAYIPWVNTISKKHAGSLAVSCHGLMWIVDLIVDSGVISVEKALEVVNKWLLIHPMKTFNKAIPQAFEEKVRKWNNIRTQD